MNTATVALVDYTDPEIGVIKRPDTSGIVVPVGQVVVYFCVCGYNPDGTVEIQYAVGKAP